jgi:hypothetical protein
VMRHCFGDRHKNGCHEHRRTTVHPVMPTTRYNSEVSRCRSGKRATAGDRFPKAVRPVQRTQGGERRATVNENALPHLPAGSRQ